MRRHVTAVIAAVALTALISFDTPVRALWTQLVPGATGEAASLTLTAPSALAATGTCSILVIGPAVDLEWTASSSTFASGYEILRSTSASGPFVVVGTVTGSSTVSATDIGLLPLTTYHYRVRSRAGAWMSPVTSTVSATTPLVCL